MTDPPVPAAPGAAAAAGGPPPMDPVAVIRSKAYLSALVLAALLGAPISAVAYGFLVLVTKIQAWLFTDLPADVFGGAAPAWWPVPWVTLAGLLTGADHPVPAGQRRPLARPRVRHGRRAAARPRPARCRPRGARHPEPRRGARPGGAAHRHRRGPRGPDRAPGEEGRAADGPDDHGLGGQLRGHQHPAGLAPARRVPHHGGGRHRRGHAQPRGPARAPGLRHRGPGLHRPRQLDRAGHLLARPDVGAARGGHRRSPPSCGRCRWASPGP